MLHRDRDRRGDVFPGGRALQGAREGRREARTAVDAGAACVSCRSERKIRAEAVRDGPLWRSLGPRPRGCNRDERAARVQVGLRGACSARRSCQRATIDCSSSRRNSKKASDSARRCPAGVVGPRASPPSRAVAIQRSRTRSRRETRSYQVGELGAQASSDLSSTVRDCTVAGHFGDGGSVSRMAAFGHAHDSAPDRPAVWSDVGQRRLAAISGRAEHRFVIVLQATTVLRGTLGGRAVSRCPSRLQAIRSASSPTWTRLRGLPGAGLKVPRRSDSPFRSAGTGGTGGRSRLGRQCSGVLGPPRQRPVRRALSWCRRSRTSALAECSPRLSPRRSIPACGMRGASVLARERPCRPQPCPDV
jgi:hypothetical protein